MSRSSPLQTGFTLIEVLVALLIAGFLLPALLTAFSSQADGLGYLREKSVAQWVAANKLTEARLELRRTRAVFEGKREGSVEMAEREWFWKMSSEKTQVEDFYRVQGEVAAGSEDSSPLYTLVGFMAASPPPGGVGG